MQNWNLNLTPVSFHYLAYFGPDQIYYCPWLRSISCVFSLAWLPMGYWWATRISCQTGRNPVTQVRSWKRALLCAVNLITVHNESAPKNLGKADRCRESSLGSGEGTWTCRPNRSLGSLLWVSVLWVNRKDEAGGLSPLSPRGWGWQLPAVKRRPVAVDTL